MKEDKLISNIFKNIEKGISLFGLKEYSTSLEGLVIDKNKNNDKIEIIIREVCNCYQVSKSDLINSTERGKIQDARNMAVALLFFNAEVPIRVIAKKVFGREWHTFVTKAINRHRNVKPEISVDKEYLNKYNHLESIINSYE
jgi:chromosomal replication initiation ATPase DnaA